MTLVAIDWLTVWLYSNPTHKGTEWIAPVLERGISPDGGRCGRARGILGVVMRRRGGPHRGGVLVPGAPVSGMRGAIREAAQQGRAAAGKRQEVLGRPESYGDAQHAFASHGRG